MSDNEARDVISEAVWIQRSPYPAIPADAYLPDADGILTALSDAGFAVEKLPEPTEVDDEEGFWGAYGITSRPGLIEYDDGATSSVADARAYALDLLAAVAKAEK